MSPLMTTVPLSEPMRLRESEDRNQLRHRLAMLGDDDAVGVHVVEQGQALFFELGGSDLLHGHNI